MDYEDAGNIEVSFSQDNDQEDCIIVSIPVVDDLRLELNETFLIEFGMERDPSIILTNNSTLISIIDNDRK